MRSASLPALVAIAMLSGCAVLPQADGTVKTVVVGCEATSPAKSIACASNTLKALVASADKALLAGQLSNEQLERLQLRFENVYRLIQQAETAAQVGDGRDGDYLQLADDLLAAVEKELAK